MNVLAIKGNLIFSASIGHLAMSGFRLPNPCRIINNVGDRMLHWRRPETSVHFMSVRVYRPTYAVIGTLAPGKEYDGNACGSVCLHVCLSVCLSGRTSTTIARIDPI